MWQRSCDYVKDWCDYQFFVVESESECWPIATRLPAHALIELHYITWWGSHYSPWLICNEQLSSTTCPQIDSYIDFILNKKNILLSADKTPITRTSNIAHTVTLIMHFRRINYWPAVLVFVLVWMWTAASLCFSELSVLLWVLVWGQISQLWRRSINPDRSIVPPPFTNSDQLLALSLSVRKTLLKVD